jgi:hypothetical protein
MDVKYLDPKVLVDDGYLQEANRLFFHPLGLALEMNKQDGTIKVWDYRDDPEGLAFSEKVNLKPKADKITDIEAQRYAIRKRALGYWVQPVLS